MPQILKRIKNQGARIKQRTLHTDKRGRIQIITDRAYSVTSPWRACGRGKEGKERAIKNRFTERHKEVTKVHRERFFISRGKEGKERAIKNRFTERHPPQIRRADTEDTEVHRERLFISRGKEGKERAIKDRFTEKDFLYLARKKGKTEWLFVSSKNKH